jgi:hypothetical protein
VVERDLPALGLSRADGGTLLAPLACALAEVGLCVTECRQATAADLVDLGSSWAKRLGIPERRPAWWLAARRPRNMLKSETMDHPPCASA